MLLLLVYALTAPAWSQSWALRRDGLDRWYGGFGIGRTKRTEISALDRIELHPAEAGDWRGALLRLNGFSADTGKFSLSLVVPSQEEILSINSLTEGEARWIADTVLRNYPEWFCSHESRRKGAARGALTPAWSACGMGSRASLAKDVAFYSSITRIFL